MSITDHPGFRTALQSCTATQCSLIIAAAKAAEEFAAAELQSPQGAHQGQWRVQISREPNPTEPGLLKNCHPIASAHLQTPLSPCEIQTFDLSILGMTLGEILGLLSRKVESAHASQAAAVQP